MSHLVALTNPSQKVVAANNSALPLKGVVEVTCSWDGTLKPFKFPFYVTSALVCKCILGVDFLISQNCVVNLPKQKLQVGDQMLPLNCVNTVRLTPKPATLSLTQDEVIPALHEKYIVCTVTESLQGKFDGLVESTPEIKDKLGILIATGIAECKDAHCFARVANIHSYPIKLYKKRDYWDIRETTQHWYSYPTPMSTTSKEDHVCSVNTTKSDPLALILKSVETSITKDQQQNFSALLHEFEDIFSKNEWDISRTHVYEHTIPMLPHAVPFKRCYKLNESRKA